MMALCNRYLNLPIFFVSCWCFYMNDSSVIDTRDGIKDRCLQWFFLLVLSLGMYRNAM